VPLSEEVEEYLHVALEMPMWRRELESLLKCSFALALTDVIVRVLRLGWQIEGHTWLP